MHKKDTPKCVNCGGEHSAAYNGCEQAQKAQEVQKIKVLNNLSYAQAARQLKEEKDNMQAQAPIPLERKLAPPQQHLNTANNPQPSVDLGLNTVKQESSDNLRIDAILFHSPGLPRARARSACINF